MINTNSTYIRLTELAKMVQLDSETILNRLLPHGSRVIKKKNPSKKNSPWVINVREFNKLALAHYARNQTKDTQSSDLEQYIYRG